VTDLIGITKIAGAALFRKDPRDFDAVWNSWQLSLTCIKKWDVIAVTY
jgi:hypothetical protein